MNRCKRWISVLGLVAMLASLVAGCGGKEPTISAGQPTVAVGQQAETAVPTTVPPTPEPEATPTTAPTATLPKAAGGVREVDFVAYAEGPDGPFGVCRPMKITVDPNPDEELRVGFYEQEVGGSGPMWRAAGWMASITGSFLLGEDLSDHRFTFDVSGWVDGPSAGGLMTVAVLAAMRGDEVRPDATMTGTINPDGTIGPVGGIPQKLEGAADKGKQLVLIPVGARYSLDMAERQYVDVVEYGQRLGMEVREVADVYQAYQLLTGQPLPRPVGAEDLRPEMPSGAFEKVKAKVKEWLGRYEKAKGQYESLPEAVRIAEFNEMMQTAQGEADRANRYFGQGMMVAAYGAASDAALSARMAYQMAKTTEVLGISGLEAVLSHLQSVSAVSSRLDALLDRLKVEQPRSLSDALAIIDAYGEVSIAFGLLDMASTQVGLLQEAETDEDLLTALYMAVLFYEVTDHAAELAEDALEVGLGYGEPVEIDPDRVKGLAEVLRRAADANLTYFETVWLSGMAEAYDMHPDAFKRVFMGYDLSYAFANSSRNVVPWLESQLGDTVQGSYAVLGGSLASFQLSSLMIAKYYSLGAETDQDGNVVSVRNEKALLDGFDFVERRARENIALATSLGAEPVLPIIYYEQARVLREGNIEDKLQALQDYWLASLEAQALAVLSGKMVVQ